MMHSHGMLTLTPFPPSDLSWAQSWLAVSASGCPAGTPRQRLYELIPSPTPKPAAPSFPDSVMLSSPHTRIQPLSSAVLTGSPYSQSVSDSNCILTHPQQLLQPMLPQRAPTTTSTACFITGLSPSSSSSTVERVVFFKTGTGWCNSLPKPSVTPPFT